MLDSRQVMRGACTECPEGECLDYELTDSEGSNCSYCSCPPVKHIRVQPQSENERLSKATKLLAVKDDRLLSEHEPPTKAAKLFLTEEYSTATSSSQCSNSDPLLDSTKAGASKNNIAVPEAVKILQGTGTGYKLPEYTELVSPYLSDPAVLHGTMWNTFISETCHFYLEDPTVSSRLSYQSLGMKFMMEYPAIKSDNRKHGQHPWSKFTKSLSRKMRKERIKVNKTSTTAKAKGFEKLAQFIVGSSSDSREKKLEPHSKTTFGRNGFQGAMVQSDEQITKCKKEISSEWKIVTKDMGCIKALVMESYHHRTSLLSASTAPFWIIILVLKALKFFSTSSG